MGIKPLALIILCLITFHFTDGYIVVCEEVDGYEICHVEEICEE